MDHPMGDGLFHNTGPQGLGILWWDGGCNHLRSCGSMVKKGYRPWSEPLTPRSRSTQILRWSDLEIMDFDHFDQFEMTKNHHFWTCFDRSGWVVIMVGGMWIPYQNVITISLLRTLRSVHGIVNVYTHAHTQQDWSTPQNRWFGWGPKWVTIWSRYPRIDQFGGHEIDHLLTTSGGLVQSEWNVTQRVILKSIMSGIMALLGLTQMTWISWLRTCAQVLTDPPHPEKGRKRGVKNGPNLMISVDSRWSDLEIQRSRPPRSGWSDPEIVRSGDQNHHLWTCFAGRDGIVIMIGGMWNPNQT